MNYLLIFLIYYLIGITDQKATEYINLSVSSKPGRAVHWSENSRIKLSTNTSPMARLTKENMDFYGENGYIVIKGLVDYPSVLKYKQRFADICSGKEHSATIIKEYALFGKEKKLEQYVNKIQEILHDEVFMTYSENPHILDIASHFVGDGITAINLMLINKPPGSVRHPPHQDIFYLTFRPLEKLVAVWTALDPAKVENGCLYVIPGSHKPREMWKHTNSVGDSKIFFHGIADEERLAPAHKRVYLVMNPGDTVFFHPYLLHGSGPNLTQEYRKAMTIHYASNACQYVDVKGTMQEELVNEFQRIMSRHGKSSITYEDMWRMKTKLVRGVKSNL